MSIEIKNKERKVFLENLPKYYKGDGKNGSNGSTNWSESIGMSFGFEYMGLTGNIDIIGYDVQTKKAKLKYGEITEDIFIGHIKHGKIGKVLGLVTSDFKIEIGACFKDDKRDIVIIDRRKIKMNRKDGKNEYKKYYKFICNKCGYDCSGYYKNDVYKTYIEELWVEESKILGKRQGGCACCHGDITVESINSIVAMESSKWMIDYFPNGYEEAKQYSPQSNNKVYMRCIDCGKISKNKVNICNLYYRHRYMCVCNDGISFPEKVMMSVLEHLQLKFEYQKSFKWSQFEERKVKRYDFYLPRTNTIIEVHGEQHYRDAWDELEKTRNNDIFKKDLAKKNGIVDYIVIDCRSNDFNYIKNNIINSEYFKTYDINNIDWDLILKLSMTNLSKKVADRWNNRLPHETTNHIALVFDISRATVIRYLKQWTEIGYTEYNANYEIYKNNTRKSKPKRNKSQQSA